MGYTVRIVCAVRRLFVIAGFLTRGKIVISASISNILDILYVVEQRSRNLVAYGVSNQVFSSSLCLVTHHSSFSLEKSIWRSTSDG